MMKITLSDQERLQLEEVFQTTADARLCTRCQASLMAHRGRRHRHIAKDLGLTVWTRQRWLRAYPVERLAGLKLRWRPGRTARLRAALAPEILGWILQGPSGYGLDRANWTYAELATQLYRTPGIAVSVSTMRAFCPNHGVRPYRPTYHYLKADPAQQTLARQDLQALKKGRGGGARLVESR